MKILLSTVTEAIIDGVVLGGVPQSLINMIKHFPSEWEVYLITKQTDDHDFILSLRKNIKFVRTALDDTNNAALPMKKKMFNADTSVNCFINAQYNIKPDFSIWQHISSMGFSRLAKVEPEHWAEHKTFLITHWVPQKSFMGERFIQLYRTLVGNGINLLYNSEFSYNMLRRYEIPGTREYNFSEQTNSVPARPKQPVLEFTKTVPLLVLDPVDIQSPATPKVIHIGRADGDRMIGRTASAIKTLKLKAVIYTTMRDEDEATKAIIESLKDIAEVKVNYSYSEMMNEICDATVFISSCPSETFGLAFAEASIRGIPCIHITNCESAPKEHVPSCVIIKSPKEILAAYREATGLDRNDIAAVACARYGLENYQQQWKDILNEYSDR